MENLARATYGDAGHIIKTGIEVTFKKPTREKGPFSPPTPAPAGETKEELATQPLPYSPDEFELAAYKEELKEYIADSKAYKEKKSKLFALTRCHMSRHSQTLVENKAAYAKSETDSDVIGLMKLIQETHQAYNGLDKQSRVTALTKELIAFKQHENQSTLDYVQKYRERIVKCKQAEVDFTNEAFYVTIFLQSLNSANREYINRILDPTALAANVPKTLEAAFAQIESYHNYLVSTGQSSNSKPKSTEDSTSSAVVAAVNVPNGKKRKGKKTGGAHSNSGNREKCTHCGRLHPSDQCFSLPANAAKKAAHDAMLKARHDKQKTVLLTMMEEILNMRDK